MLVHEGDARTRSKDETLAWTFASLAGALNAAGFYAFGSYTSNMTGNVSALADHLGLGEIRLGLQALALVAAFVAGAMAATLLIGLGRARHLRGIYAYGILVEAALLAALGASAPLMPGDLRGPVLALGLSFLLGLQNATVTQITDARVRTTHVTGMVTDIGIGLAAFVDRRAVTDRARLRLHLLTVGAFLGGGIAGALLYRGLGTALLLVVAGVMAVLAIPQIGSARRV